MTCWRLCVLALVVLAVQQCAAVSRFAFYTSGPYLTQDQANAVCASKGGWLATPNTLEEQAALMDASGGLGYFWLGGRYVGGTFQWIYGPLDQRTITFTYYYSGQPNSFVTGNTLIMIQGSGQGWHDLDAAEMASTTWQDRLHRFPCEFTVSDGPAVFTLYNTGILSFDSANEYCSDRGGWLASPKDAGEYATVQSITSSNYIWLGSRVSYYDSGVFSWPFGPANERRNNYFVWAPGQPNSYAGGNVAIVIKAGNTDGYAAGWHDLDNAEQGNSVWQNRLTQVVCETHQGYCCPEVTAACAAIQARCNGMPVASLNNLCANNAAFCTLAATAQAVYGSCLRVLTSCNNLQTGCP